jgi:adenine-specific DNA-methyltransferase
MGFMLPRLVFMRELLKDTGIAAISIDDYEYAQLKILMDQVFGADNHFGTLIVHRSKNGKGSKAHIAVSHEHVLIYGKTSKAKIVGLPELDTESYTKKDSYGRYKIDGLFRKKGEASKRTDRPNMFFPLYYDDQGNVFTENPTGKLREALPVDSKGGEKRWLWGIDKARADSWRLYASPQGVIYVKNYLTEEKRIKVRSLWDDPRYLTERATNEITEIYGEKVFETPKPLGLIEDLIKCCAPQSAVILDFFCGTATTAHAAYNVNKEDGGKRQVILVEHEAKIPHDHIAATQGFKDIAAIAEFRLHMLSESDPSYRFKSLTL